MRKSCTTPAVSIDVSKSNGPDKISGRMLKATALSIAPSITNGEIEE